MSLRSVSNNTCNLARVASAPHLEWEAVYDSRYQLREFVIPGSQFSVDSGYGGPVVALETPSESVNQQLLGKAANEGVPISLEERLEFSGRLKGSAIRQFAGSVHGEFAVLRPPGAYGAEILQAKAERIHSGVAGGTGPTLAMLLHLLPQRAGLGLGVIQRRHTGRGGRRRRIQQIFQNPLTAKHRRRARRIRRNCEDT